MICGPECKHPNARMVDKLTRDIEAKTFEALVLELLVQRDIGRLIDDQDELQLPMAPQCLAKLRDDHLVGEVWFSR